TAYCMLLHFPTRRSSDLQVIQLLDEGNTVPFIARYRKEATGGLDEVEIKSIQDRWTYVVQLAERKAEVLRLIDEQGKLTEELKRSEERRVGKECRKRWAS